MAPRKRIALVADAAHRGALLEWALAHRDALGRHALSAPEPMRTLLARELGLPVTRHPDALADDVALSGELVPDARHGEPLTDAVRRGGVDVVVCFVAPDGASGPDGADGELATLLALAAAADLPIACTRATADFVLASPLLGVPYTRRPAAPGGDALGGRSSPGSRRRPPGESRRVARDGRPVPADGSADEDATWTWPVLPTGRGGRAAC